MYAIVCGTLSDSLDLLQEGKIDKAKRFIQEALEKAEDCYISAGV